jgi:acyl-CoA synthetase (AMP-forming)/AMP-acid ligase II
MAASGDPDRVAVVDGDIRLTTAGLSGLADGGAGVITASGADHVVYVGTGGVLLPMLLFSSARANTAFTPLNYRLSADGLRQLIDRLPDPLIVVDVEYRDVVAGVGERVMTSDEFIEAAGSTEPVSAFADPDDVAVVLFTSGTTSRPKAVELTHNNLTSYVTGTVEFGSADPADAALVCLPPYHIAGVGAALSNLYAGRAIVYLRRFDPQEWVRLVRDERVTTATVVPTMLSRIVAVLEQQSAELPTLRNFAYGGSKVARPLVRRALDLLPDVGFVNAYGLTETSSTIAVLTPEDHRQAHQARDDAVLGPGEAGELFVRGPQVSGRYAEIGSVLDAEGWFPTKDVAMLDEDGYLFIGGRSDDTIIRGGENIAPSEIEDVLVEHPDVSEVVVVGPDDAEWGQIIVAVIVLKAGAAPTPEQLRDFTRNALRGSRTPDRIVFRDELPTTPTGKVLRREILDDLKPAAAEH